MEKLKVLIIRDEDDFNLYLSDILIEMLNSLGLKSDFCYADDTDAIKKIGFWGYGIICSNISTLESGSFFGELSDYLTRHNNKNLATFFISTEEWQVKKIKELGFKLSFLKDKKRIISLDDLAQVKQSILNTGKINCQINYQDLIDPICIFCTTYADSTPTEAWAQKACNEVAIRLNCRQIHYSVIDSVGYSISIYVEDKNVKEVKKIAESSDLEFWAGWSKKYLK